MKASNRLFFDRAKAELEERGVTLYLSKGRNVNFPDDHSRVSGYWDEDRMFLAVGTGGNESDWMSNFVHEYSHFKQWAEKNDAWRQANKYSGYLWRWLDGENFDDKWIKREIAITKNLELDCERRTIKLIKKYGLPINLEQYAQGAAAYIYYYDFLFEFRHWFPPSQSPYRLPDILKVMPKTLRGHFKTVPEKIQKLYYKHYL